MKDERPPQGDAPLRVVSLLPSATELIALVLDEDDLVNGGHPRAILVGRKWCRTRAHALGFLRTRAQAPVPCLAHRRPAASPSLLQAPTNATSRPGSRTSPC